MSDNPNDGQPAGDPPPSDEPGTNPPAGTPTDTPADEPAGNSSDDATPPWGTDDKFDPAKAWKLIQNLRGDLDELKPKAAKLKEIEDAEKTDLQRAQEELESERTEHGTTRGELARLRAAVKHGLSEEDLELLGTGTPEEIEQRAERLAARLNAGDTTVVPASDRQGRTGDAPRQDPAKVVDNLPPLG